MDALVTDGDLVGAVSGLRGLAAAGVRTLVLSPERPAAGLLSRHTALRAVGPDPGADPAGFAACVAELAVEHGPLVVYPSREESLDALFAAGLPEQAVLPYAGPESLARLRDKGGLPQLAPGAGLRTATTLAEGPAAAIGDIAVDGAVMVKPGARGPGIPEVAIARTRAELRRALASCPPALDVVVQEHLEGPLVCVAVVVGRDGRLIERFQQQAGRIFPPDAGACTTAVSVAPDEELCAASARLVADAGYWGLAQLDFILTADGPRLIDVNPRFYISLSLALASGVNLPAAWHAVAMGEETHPAPGDYRTGVWYRRLESDVAAALRGRPGLLIARTPRPRVGAVWSRRDPLPGAWIALRRVTGFGIAHLSRRESDADLPVTITDLADPAGLAAEWREHERRAPPSPYLSWDWLEAWLAVYRPRHPAVVRVGAPGRPPVALGLLDRPPGGRWEFAGAPISPNRGLLVADAHRAAAWRALAAELHAQRHSWTSLGVEGVAVEASVLPCHRLAPVSSWVVSLPGDFDAYLKARSPSQRKAHKQKLRRLAAANGEITEVAPDDQAAALRAFLEFHSLRAATKGERHPQMNDDLLALLGRLSHAPDTPLRVFALRVAGELAGVTIRLDRPGASWFYNAGFDPAHHRLGPGVLLELGSIRDAIERGHRRFDLGPGFWRYKVELGGEEDPLLDGHAFSPALRGRIMREVVQARRRGYAALPGREVLRGVRRRRALRRAGSSSGPSTAG